MGVMTGLIEGSLYISYCTWYLSLSATNTNICLEQRGANKTWVMLRKDENKQ